MTLKLAPFGSVRALKHPELADKDNRIRVTIVFDKLGRQESVANGVATSTFTYTAATLALDTETITYNLPSQPAFTRVIDRSRYNLGRDSGWQLKKGNTIENQAEYQYSATDGRLSKVLGLASSSLPSPQFTYGYTPNSHLLAAITGPAHTVTNQYEPTRDVLASKENKAGTTIISKYDYTVNCTTNQIKQWQGTANVTGVQPSIENEGAFGPIQGNIVNNVDTSSARASGPMNPQVTLSPDGKTKTIKFQVDATAVVEISVSFGLGGQVEIKKGGWTIGAGFKTIGKSRVDLKGTGYGTVTCTCDPKTGKF